MSRFSRDELEKAFEHRQAHSAATMAAGDFEGWASQYTEDAVYMEHGAGELRGRTAISDWIAGWMAKKGASVATFEIEWMIFDDERGWIVYCLQNQMPDLGDGVVRQAPAFILLKYAGDNQWSYQEDIYNPREMRDITKDWFAAKEALAGT
jgi:ketosteroid isomerase-like protein